MAGDARYTALRMDFAGPLETHLTFQEDRRRPPERIAAIAAAHGLKVTHIVLDAGAQASQPMFTRRRNGTLPFELAEAQALAKHLGDEGLAIRRVKIEAMVTNGDVPRTDEAAVADVGRYFEHHVKVRRPKAADEKALAELAGAHGAHVSRNAMHEEDDGVTLRFLTQRFYDLGRDGAKRRLDALLAALAEAAIEVVDVQEEYVVYDDHTALDAGWIDVPKRPQRVGFYPNTFLALEALDSPDGGTPRKELFDPALKHFSRAFRRGDPELDEGRAKVFGALRRRALEHVVRTIAGTPFGERLVLRGSVLLASWLGPAAREPADLDFVVEPASLGANDDEAIDMLRAIAGAVDASPVEGLVFSARDVAIDAIWTYERAEGRRLVLPYRARGFPAGSVQLDFVFREELPEPAQRMALASATGEPIAVRAASPQLSLAWKLLWLATDMHPQGKDLYDATLLAEKFPVSRLLLARVLGDDVHAKKLVADPFVLLQMTVEWEHLVAELPLCEGSELSWKTRLAEALARGFEAL